jgi:hypothetical protein
MQDAIEIPLSERQRQILAKRDADLQEAITRRSTTLLNFVEMHGDHQGAIEFKDGKLYVLPASTPPPTPPTPIPPEGSEPK